MPRTNSSGNADFLSGRQSSCQTLSSHALHLGKSDRCQSRCRSHAEVVVAAASWERRQVSALRPRIKIGNDRRTHGVVLLALPKENRLARRRWRLLDAFPSQQVLKRLPTL